MRGWRLRGTSAWTSCPRYAKDRGQTRGAGWEEKLNPFCPNHPCLGEDNEYICKQIPGYSDDQVTEVPTEGVITAEYDVPE